MRCCASTASSRGAFDGKHPAIDLPPHRRAPRVTLTVDRRALPVAGLPAGDGLRWRWMLAREEQRPAPRSHRGRALAVGLRRAARCTRRRAADARSCAPRPRVAVAFADSRRKALRTFATAAAPARARRPLRVRAEPAASSYAWVEADDPDLFARVRERIGEVGMRASHRCGSSPTCTRSRASRSCGNSLTACATRPNSSASSRTSSGCRTRSAFRHAADARGARRHALFATAKLQWNETTRWPYPQFRWYGDDGAHLRRRGARPLRRRGDAARKAIARERARDSGARLRRRRRRRHRRRAGGGRPHDAAVESVGEWFAGVEARTLPQFAANSTWNRIAAPTRRTAT